MAEYKVKFEVFEGPLDLLLYLIKKEEVDIYEVNLTQLATQFIEYIETMRLLDLEIAGEFLVMAATLMYIKSRELLPVDQQAQVEGEEEGEDPRWELIRQLVEYKKFKDAAAQLQALEAAAGRCFPAPAPANWNSKPIAARPSRRFPFSTCSTRSMPSSSASASARGPAGHLRGQMDGQREDRVPDADLAAAAGVEFSELFEGVTSRSEVVVTFLALLELIRLKQLVCAAAASRSARSKSAAPPGSSGMPGALASHIDRFNRAGRKPCRRAASTTRPPHSAWN